MTARGDTTPKPGQRMTLFSLDMRRGKMSHVDLGYYSLVAFCERGGDCPPAIASARLMYEVTGDGRYETVAQGLQDLYLGSVRPRATRKGYGAFVRCVLASKPKRCGYRNSVH